MTNNDLLNATIIFSDTGYTKLDGHPGYYTKTIDGKVNYYLLASNFNTPLLNFDLNHPVMIEIQPSYDGSINLILNDGKNNTRLINTRFSVEENGMAKIPDRRRNDDNIYSEDNFDLDTSLTKKINQFPIVEYNGVLNSGNLKVGNYTFYFKYCDVDGNETDWIAESGIVSIFKGNDKDPFSIDGGVEDMNAHKSVQFNIYNIDSAYHYIKVYYVRSSAAKDQNAVTRAYEIVDPFEIKNTDTCEITITGDESMLDMDLSEIQTQYQLADTVKAQAQCQNMLFQANVTEADIHYKDLTDLSLAIIPYADKIKSSDRIGHISQETYLDDSGITEKYSDHIFKNEYYNTRNIYYNVGYWNEEFYRLGIVYIYNDNSISSVYNIVGGELNEVTTGIFTLSNYTYSGTIPESGVCGRQYMTITDNNYIVTDKDGEPTNDYINNRGVIHINDPEGTVQDSSKYTNTQYIYKLRLSINSKIINYLKALKIKGFFVVRQKRIPQIACQGFTLPWDKEAKVPILEYFGIRNLILDEHNETESLKEFNKIYVSNELNSNGYGLINGVYKDIKTNGTRGHLFYSKIYQIESFVYQIGDESVDYLNSNIGKSARKKDSEDKLLINYIGQDYISRLYDILPICIDNKILQYSINGETSDSSGNNLYTLKPIGGYVCDYPRLYSSNVTLYQADCKRVEDKSGFDSANFFIIYDQEDYYINRQVQHMSTDDIINQTFSISNAYIPKHLEDLYKNCDGNQLTAISPEFEIDQAHYNEFFTGTEYTVKYTNYQQGMLVRKKENERLYYTEYDPLGQGVLKYKVPLLFKNKNKTTLTYKICSVTDNVPVVAIDNTIFKSVIGSAQEAYRFSFINEEKGPARYTDFFGTDTHENSRKQDFNLIRGIYSPYLGIISEDLHDITGDSIRSFSEPQTEKDRGYSRTFNIYYNNYNDTTKTKYQVRFDDNSPYYTISSRFTIDNLIIKIKKIKNEQTVSYIVNDHLESELQLNKNNNNIIINLFRGDCFLCTFTHRLNRNFNDPVAPTNDSIIDPETWRKYYCEGKEEITTDNGQNTGDLAKINRGDINAVKLGSWITIKVKASRNLSIRSLDESFTTEMGEMGRARGFYPLQQASADGGYKLTNSYVFNAGFASTVGAKWYNTQPDAAYIKNEFHNRIMYSDINVTDSQKNGYRVFRATHYRDYTKQYGQITKIIELHSNLLIIFEHGVALVPVNERALAGEGSGGNIYVNTSKVLPETINVLNDMYGSQWQESVIKTPYWIYGVDTVAKKIWATNGQQFKIISDFKVEKFLLDNITLKENDTEPFIGIKNVVSHYNAGKSDVLFTFYFKKYDEKITYDCLGNKASSAYDKFEDDEVAWNICHNMLLGGQNGQFTTFYSWVPLYTANIDNVMYSFDREYARDTILKCYGVTTELQKENPDKSKDADRLKPYLWKHGPLNEKQPYPCFWYNEQHPFEFEFVVNQTPNIQKIFNNLEIISNKAEPESFHFTVVGEGYEFNNDKPNMYVRQESTKQLYKQLGSDISYKDNYNKLISKELERQPKSTILPLYYANINTMNDIYDSYTQMLDSSHSRDYCNLSGSEIAWDEVLNDFNIQTHIKCSPINGHWELIGKDMYDKLKAQNSQFIRLKKDIRGNTTSYFMWNNVGRMRGNSQYKEDRWEIQIPSITLMQKNEDWITKPPIVVNGVPDDITRSQITGQDLPNTYNLGEVDTSNWTFRKETKLRDKYIKIRIRYSGRDQVILTAILTTFTPSYA